MKDKYNDYYEEFADEGLDDDIRIPKRYRPSKRCSYKQMRKTPYRRMTKTSLNDIYEMETGNSNDYSTETFEKLE